MVSSATQQVASEAQAVATTAGQMSTAMADVATSAVEAMTVAAEAAEVTRQVRSSVGRLTASTEQIDDVVRMVSGISDQTQLLALNATIEAARAGSAGRGFAVVAEEVKNLAVQTGQATTDIARKLSELAEGGQSVRAATERIDQVLSRVESLQQVIAAAVEQQGAAIAEITRSAGEAAGAAASLRESVEASVAATHVAEEAITRSRTWLERLGAAAMAQRQEIEGLGSGVQSHPLRQAIVAHAAWRRHLRQAIHTGRMESGADPATVARNDVCAFGQWLHSSEAGELDPHRAARIGALHADFHRAAGAVLAAAVAGDREKAEHLLVDDRGYAGTAAALCDALIEWAGLVEDS
jgi:chromosome segregation ATPase